MTEKRTQLRFEVGLDARWQGSAAKNNVRLADLSEGGCYVGTILEVIKGETLFLNILMPDGERFEVQGLVAHHSPRLGFGLRFVNLDDEQRWTIRSLIDQVNPIREEQPEASWGLEQIDVTCHEIM